MARQFTNIAFTDGVKEVQSRYGSRSIYESFLKHGVSEDILTAKEIDFIAARDSFYMGTGNSDGWPYVQFRGGAKGFLKVLDQKTLGFADFKGNLQYLSVGNLSDNDRVFLFLMDYRHRRRLKIWGRAQVIDNNPELINQLMDVNYAAEPERVIIIQVEALDWNCPQHIPVRYSEAEVAEMITPLNARIQELETKLAELSNS
ncbi:MAG: pyridoxamine 5'-phosphate oxidase family protein [Sphaerospermopsis sp. SIO1G2]|nr:pyridoxamine 5'-phosphate oxidase family protein [Sphaerospermopsis sp. SIO1G1]NET70522.1 pyridoxamine 5'-phosphate oxidase family protein [Sphaerospermopsis sp. SIO1G2]